MMDDISQSTGEHSTPYGHGGPPRLFISHRRKDSLGYSVALRAGLVAPCGEENVFVDVRAIPAGVDFREHIWDRIEWCDVLLVLIGPSWLTVTDDSGRPRLHNRDDFVRLEIEYALDLNKRVIPLLVGGAGMPSPGQLPESLVRLSYREAHDMTDAHWEYDLDVLLKRVTEPRPNRFSKWGDIRPLAPVRALVKNALLGPRRLNPVLPLALTIVGIATSQWWLVAVALASYLAFFLITLFELDQARRVHAKTWEGSDREAVPRPLVEQSGRGGADPEPP
jgi:TIR domain-containing protein